MRGNRFLDARVCYFMQMVIPNIFSIDAHGWGATAESFPHSSKRQCKQRYFELLRTRINSNKSKFSQPEYKRTNLEPGYFFPCQLPHDETMLLGIKNIMIMNNLDTFNKVFD